MRCIGTGRGGHGMGEGHRMTTVTRIVLRAIDEAPEGSPAFAAGLVRSTDLEEPTVSQALRRLTERGWLVREREVGDPSVLGRPLRVFYRLTAAGREGAGAVLGGSS